MARVLEFKLPDLGEGLTEAEIVRWLVAVGDVVAIDQPVVEVETAKAMVEVPCPYGGVVTARYGEEGEELPVGAPLLTVAVGAPDDGVADDGAPVAGVPADATGGSKPAAPAPEPGSSGAAPAGGAEEGSGNVLVGYGTSAAAARRRRVRPAAPVGAAAPVPSASAVPAAAAAPGAVTGAPAAPTASAAEAVRAVSVPVDGPAGSSAPAAPLDGPVPVISPLVRKLARERGLDLRQLRGSGPDGLILRVDVERASTAPAPSPEPPHTASGPTVSGHTAPTHTAPGSGPGAEERVPLRGVRGAVADKLSRSRREIPDATCWVDADATELMAARAAMNAAGGPKISLLALLARICTAALARYPELNSRVDQEAREIVRLPAVHLGFAAQTERGLVVPVVRDAHGRSAESLTAEFARLTEAARTGSLSPGQLTGGTFTLNNYGVFGVDGSTPIINHPEAAMLGVGRIIPKPWVHQGELAVRQVVQLSLTFDHRVCDGGTAGGFLRYVADCVEQPAVLLRTL
ncbi:dihydrolipoamide acetyltransferase family protein [Streptomyces kanasensis]|uniref:dihydrolipoamide acetyltransferase family protein n=1 Tax=Streptomyces kanasensis TaxID=936756 RepID=UPI0037FFFB5E